MNAPDNTPDTIPFPSAHDRIRLAAEAAVCPATVRKFFSGRPIRSTSKARIERALRFLGMTTSRPTRTA